MIFTLIDITYQIAKTTVNGIVYIFRPKTQSQDTKDKMILSLVEENNALVQENMKLRDAIDFTPRRESTDRVNYPEEIASLFIHHANSNLSEVLL